VSGEDGTMGGSCSKEISGTAASDVGGSLTVAPSASDCPVAEGVTQEVQSNPATVSITIRSLRIDRSVGNFQHRAMSVFLSGRVLLRTWFHSRRRWSGPPVKGPVCGLLVIRMGMLT
jgi:hypothetical protein